MRGCTMNHRLLRAAAQTEKQKYYIASGVRGTIYKLGGILGFARSIRSKLKFRFKLKFTFDSQRLTGWGIEPNQVLSPHFSCTRMNKFGQLKDASFCHFFSTDQQINTASYTDPGSMIRSFYLCSENLMNRTIGKLQYGNYNMETSNLFCIACLSISLRTH